jgi:hypothetical protein
MTLLDVYIDPAWRRIIHRIGARDRLAMLRLGTRASRQHWLKRLRLNTR